MPRLMVTGMSLPPKVNLRASTARRSRSATILAPFWSEPRQRMVNSSPPKRASTSSVRRSSAIICDSSASTKSPAGWPCVSLIFLKWSMSRKMSASGPLWRAAKANSFSR